MPYFKTPDHATLYYDDVAGEQGAEACFCGKHLFHHSSHTQIVPHAEQVFSDCEGTSCHFCNDCDRTDGPFSEERVFRNHGLLEEAEAAAARESYSLTITRTDITKKRGESPRSASCSRNQIERKQARS